MISLREDVCRSAEWFYNPQEVVNLRELTSYRMGCF